MSEAPKRRRRRLRAIAATVALAAAPIALVGIVAAPAGATTVTTETEFRNAWGNSAETSIVLGADITLTCGGGGNAVRNSTVPVVVDGGGTFTITQTCANSTNLGQANTGTVTLRGVTISGGNRGVVSNAADVVLEHSTITDIADTAVSAAYGVYSMGGVTLDDSHISDVTAAGAEAMGAISPVGSVTLVNGSTITGVHVTGNNGEAFGGAAASGSVTLDHATISDITGASTGAGGFIGGGTIVVTDSRIADIHGTGAAGFLGANGVTFTRSTIDGVTATSGAATGLSLQTTEASSITASEIANVTSTDDFAAGILAGGPLGITDALIHQITSTNDTAAGILEAGSAVDVTVTATTVSDVTGLGAFGVVDNDGVLTVTDSAIESIDASAGTIAFGLNGGGVAIVTGTEISDVVSGQIALGASGDTSLTLARSTIRGVQAPNLAAGVNANEEARVENSTITGVTGYGAVVFGPLTVVYSDIVGNGTETTPVLPSAAAARTLGLPAGFGTITLPDVVGSGDVQAQALSFGQVRGDGGITLFGTVLTSPIGVFGNCAETAAVTSAGYNFVDDTSCNLAGTGDRQGVGLDPQLGALAFNGGPTQTMAITNTSPLYDAIPSAACQSGPAAGVTTDQRGVTRPGFTGCDIGAFEIESPVPVNILPKFTG